MPLDERGCNILVAGIGGTGVLTIGALLGMAAHLEGKVADIRADLARSAPMNRLLP